VDSDRYSDEFENAAGGTDYEEPGQGDAGMGSFFDRGPEALFNDIENLVPEPWRQQVVRFPISAVAVGVVVGFFLGYKKGQELVTAGSSFIAAAAAANINQFVASRVAQGDE
jgi:hypothetical protein